MKRFLVTLALAAALAAPCAFGAEENEEGTNVTIYNSNLVVVKERRKMTFGEGLNVTKFKDVAATIDATSVRFESMTDRSGTSVEEQNYEYDLVSAAKLLDKYLDKKISIVTKTQQTYTGRLLSFDALSVVLQEDDGRLHVVARQDNVQHISCGELPEGLLVRPTLVWHVRAAKPGEHLVKVAYMAGGVNWHANYVAVLADDDKALDYSGWVTIDNRCGKTFEDAKLKLIAGDVQRVVHPQQWDAVSRGRDMNMRAAGFESKTFFEYHMYTLPRKATVKNNQTKQIELLNKTGVGCEKEYVYPGNGDKVDVKIKFKNSEANKLGIAIPKGVVRLYKKDSDGNLEFVGEDNVDHTPRDEEIKLQVGKAFDIRVEKKRQSHGKLSERSEEYLIEVKLKNHKDEKIVVTVIDKIYNTWRVVEETHKHVRIDAVTPEWKVDVAPNAETVLTYKVFRSW